MQKLVVRGESEKAEEAAMLALPALELDENIEIEAVKGWRESYDPPGERT